MHARRGQSGAAALEFAFILPLLLFLIYGMIVYAYVFIVQEAITFAAQEAAEAAVKVDPVQSPEDYQDSVRQAVAAVLRCDNTDGQGGVLSFLPQCGRVSSTVEICPSPTGIGGVVSVRLVFTFTGLFPQLPLPGIGAIPPMPSTLEARGVVGV
jgi:hypothetical protein